MSRIAHRLALAGAGLAALALGGCAAVGPNYHLPEKAAARAPAAQGAFREADAALAQARPLPARWWRLYDDPVLDTLEEQALASNTDLRVATANLGHARAVTQATEGQKEPDLNISSGVQKARLSGESYLLSESIPVSELQDTGAELSYQVDLFGRIRRSIEAAKASEQAQEATQDAVRVTVAAEVARAYVGVCGANEALGLAEQALAVQQRQLDVALRLEKAGRTSSIEVTRARELLAHAEAMLPPYRAEAKAHLYRLAFLLGRAPADYPREAEACHALPQLKGPLPVGDGAALIARRPDIRGAERQLAAATANIGVATAMLYPDITIGLSGGTTGFVDDFGTAATNRWSMFSLIHWSFPNATSRARVRAAGSQADAALARFDGVVLTALRETETALSTYAHDRDRAVALAAAREEAERANDEARRMRAAGRSPLQATLGGQQGEVLAKLGEQAQRRAMANDQIGLFLALGGGWGNEMPATKSPADKKD